VSAGIAEGRVGIVRNVAIDDFAPDEILVCHTTDPSWVSLLAIAGAVVVDVGGTMSHGAIVARELGVPCIVNTRHGTTRLYNGHLVRVDAYTGTVTPL
jgi:phosphoenolpyruvate synthase/pyruvate phosphate dikinase